MAETLTANDDEPAPIHERMAGEPTLWFERFSCFLALGPARSLEEAWRVQKDTVRREGQRPPSSWYRAAKEWRWDERATAWDDARRAEDAAARDALDCEVRAEAVNSLKERRRVWVEQAQALQAKASEALQSMNASDLSPRDLLAYYVDGIKLELLARGQAQEIHEARVRTVAPEDMTDADLARIAGAAQDREKERSD